MDDNLGTVSVEIFELTDTNWEMTLPELIKWLEDEVEEVPEEFHSSVIIKAEYGYEDHIVIKGYYTRPETTEEIQAKTDWLLKYENEKLNREISEYHRLKAKFE